MNPSSPYTPPPNYDFDHLRPLTPVGAARRSLFGPRPPQDDQESPRRFVLRKRERVAPSTTDESPAKKANDKYTFILDGQLHFAGQEYPLERIGQESRNHFVWRFIRDQEITVLGKILRTSELILKTYNVQDDPEKQRNNIRDGILAYADLRSKNIPVPECYADPSNFHDPSNALNGKCWVLEKMEEEVDVNRWKQAENFECLSDVDKKILLFARNIHTQNAINLYNKKPQHVNDFHPGNMLLKGGNVYVIDFSRVVHDPEEQLMFLASEVNAWANGNPFIFQWLVSEFPEGLKIEPHVIDIP